MNDAYRNTSPGIRRWHTSASACAAYLYVPRSAKLPELYSQEEVADPIARVKLFDPCGSWAWYLTEWDGVSTAFGLVVGDEPELGYLDLAELSAVRVGAGRLPIERDIHFTPQPLSVIRAEHDSTIRLNGLV